MKKYAVILKLGILTAVAIVLFQAISLFVVYQYVRFDLYLGVVAVCFLLTGIILKSSHPRHEPAAQQADKDEISLLNKLTNRELQTLQLIAEGKTNKEIAAIQFVEISTVKTHVNNLYSKLSVSNRKEARTKYTEMTEKS